MKKIKISNLEKQEVRRVIPYNGEEIIIIEVPINLKQKVTQILINAIQKDEDFSERDIYLELIDRCSNIEFEGDIFEVENPVHEVKILLDEFILMFQEMLEEVYSIISLALQEGKNELLKNKIIEERDEIVKIANEFEKNKQEPIVKSDEDKNTKHLKQVKRPSRSRGKIVRK